jgi:16S rRNA (cytosine1402-N4)-methyltransferase
MTGSDSPLAVAGGLARHTPVLGPVAVELLGLRAGGVYIDATFGGGGYSRLMLRSAACTVIAIDRDPAAIAQGAELARSAPGRLLLAQEEFSNLQEAARRFGHDEIDGVVFDLGVSSMQLDVPERGFSFRHNGPLDMRMGGSGPSAADVIASASERDLATIIRTLGEERRARSIAHAIVAARKQTPLRTTRALAEIVERVVHGRPGMIHPATRTFQALRMFVNHELPELAHGLAAAEAVLRPGGRLVVVAFHSLEDRLVKHFLRERSGRTGTSRHVADVAQNAPTFKLLTKRALLPDTTEIDANPRARSAKLRAAERTDAPPAAPPLSKLLPPLPPLSGVIWP